ncbi:MAG: exosome complex RNA-binding protein Rrp4 [Candidatus Woesearchaeota archaeon]
MTVAQNEVAVPGEVLATGMDYLPSYGTYRNGENIHAKIVGLAKVDGKVIKLIPLNGQYYPKKDDTVIGRVFDILISGWRLDLRSGHSAVLPLQEASNDFIKRNARLDQYFDIDEWVVCQITNVTSQKLIDVSTKGPGLRKLNGGRIITVVPYKVPRIIGKGGSMVSLIKEKTGSKVIVGQNGVIWIANETPEMELKTVEAIKFVESNAHTEGLTDRVKELLGDEE